MHADSTVFDSATVIDHATYEKPTELSEGIRFVFVNGKEELKDGVPTGEKGGQAMERSGHMPTRPLLENVARKVAAHGIVATAGGAVQLTLNVSQPAGTRHPIGTVKIVDLQNKITITGTVLGIIQTADGWASVTGRATVGADGLDKAFTVIVERADPLANGTETAVMDVEGTPLMAGPLTPGQVTVTGGKQTPPARAPRK
jgi:N-acyl-D-amino-acid deacylase